MTSALASLPSGLLPLAQAGSPQWLPWLLGLLCLAGWALAASLLLRRRSQPATPAAPASPADPTSLVPIQVLLMDLTLVHRELEALHNNGLGSLAAHLELNPALLLAWRKKAQILQANPHTLSTNHLNSPTQLQAWWDGATSSPWTDIFKHQVFLLWSDLDRMEQEITYTTDRHEELTCHMRCSIPRTNGKLNPRQVLLSLTDITLAKGGKVSNNQEIDILRDIFSQANMLVWRARVLRENGRFLWRIRLPQHASSSPLYKMAGALEVGGLWDMSRMPDAARMDATAEEAMLTGLNHYEQDFRAICSDGTHWIHEDVVIQKITDNEWSLVAVAMEVTARHRAEEAHLESQFQIQQILQSADCLLWRAQVLATPPTTFWKMFVPPSVLYRRIFGYDPDNSAPLLWQNQDIPERAELDARSTRALYEGWPGYEQEFRVNARGATFWLHEHVSITKKSDTEWTLVGVIMDVTARREAEIELAAEKEHHASALRRLQAAGLDPSPTTASAPAHPSASAPALPASPAAASASPTPPLPSPLGSASPSPAPSPAASPAPQPTLPAAPAAPTRAPAAAPKEVKPSAPPPLSGRLLLMDDEEAIQRLASRLIKRLGLDVEVCSNGQQALVKYKAAMEAGTPFDIVMVDLNIPGGMGGRETIGPLLQLDPKAKVLVSSGATGDIEPDELTELGFVGTMPKPYDIATLTRVFKSVLESGR